MPRYSIFNADGIIVNTIDADEDFVKSNYPDSYQELESINSDIVVEPARLVLGITSIDVDAEHESTTLIKGVDDVTCPVGTVLTIAAKLELSGNTVDVTDQFRMPIRSRDGREKVLLAALKNGVASIVAPMRESGAWRVTQDMINEDLPDEMKMQFTGISIYVVES